MVKKKRRGARVFTPRQFTGPEREREFFEAVKAFDGELVSADGAARMLACTRQFIYWLAEEGIVRSLVYRREPGGRINTYLVSADDIEAYDRQHVKGSTFDPAEVV